MCRLNRPLSCATMVFKMMVAGAEDATAATDDTRSFLFSYRYTTVARVYMIYIIYLVLFVKDLMDDHVLPICKAFSTRATDHHLSRLNVFHFFVGGHGGRP